MKRFLLLLLLLPLLAGCGGGVSVGNDSRKSADNSKRITREGIWVPTPKMPWPPAN